MTAFDDLRNDSVKFYETPEVELQKLVTHAESTQPLTGVDHSAKVDKGKKKVNEPVVKAIPRPLHLFLRG